MWKKIQNFDFWPFFDFECLNHVGVGDSGLTLVALCGGLEWQNSRIGLGDVGLNNIKCGLWYSLGEAQLWLCESVTHDVDSIITKSWLYSLGEAQHQLCGSLTNSNDDDISTKSWLWLFLGEAQFRLCGSLTNSTNVYMKIYCYSSYLWNSSYSNVSIYLGSRYSTYSSCLNKSIYSILPGWMTQLCKMKLDMLKKVQNYDGRV